MSFENFDAARWKSAGSAAIDTHTLSELANWCERLGPAEQGTGFERVLREVGLAGVGAQINPGQHLAALVDAEAWESAAIALLPQTAIFSGGRLRDGAFVAQVIIDGGIGAHSRNAQSLAMAWLAALLRTMGRQMAEASASGIN